MGTEIRPEISKKNKYWISKHRYYELKHFCLQYKEFKQLYLAAVNCKTERVVRTNNPEWSDPVGTSASVREEYLSKMKRIEKCCYAASDEIGEYIFKAVTEGMSYVKLKMIYDIPCGKDMFYDRYRKFFYILDRTQVTG